MGDHKQVSPSAVGTAEEKIKELSNRFLKNQPHGSEMTPDKSIYDLARVVFAGNSVMLKEHFRCVPAIIEFSNREFYQGDIKPLRLPKANERLDPPLIDVSSRADSVRETSTSRRPRQSLMKSRPSSRILSWSPLHRRGHAAWNGPGGTPARAGN